MAGVAALSPRAAPPQAQSPAIADRAVQINGGASVWPSPALRFGESAGVLLLGLRLRRHEARASSSGSTPERQTRADRAISEGARATSVARDDWRGRRRRSQRVDDGCRNSDRQGDDRADRGERVWRDGDFRRRGRRRRRREIGGESRGSCGRHSNAKRKNDHSVSQVSLLCDAAIAREGGRANANVQLAESFRSRPRGGVRVKQCK
jgi:hypothetical protein